ncbi:MAG TPA: SatD family protein [Clostridia bacterium]|nr:SatD family protein [Clostridia bacterium]
MYFAIIGDIVGSRKVSDRAELQKKLREILDDINSKYESDIASKFVITLGDEFQGLLLRPDNIIEMLNIIKIKAYPVRIRFGIGIGLITTEINPHMAIGMDGPALHNARRMIDEIKQNEKGKMSDSTDTRICEGDADSIEVRLINSNLALCSFIELKWSNKQRELIAEALLTGLSQREIAARLKIAQSSIQRRFKSAGYYDYCNAQKVIKDVLIKKWGQ